MREQDKRAGRPSWMTEHIKLYQTDPEKAHLWDASALGVPARIPTLLLTTKGRKSGRDVFSPLIYTQSPTGFVVIASNGGAPEHPNWYRNLLASPVCDIQVGPQRYRVRARIAVGEDRATLWAKMMKTWPRYDSYQQRAKGRQIPLVVLEPQK